MAGVILSVVDQRMDDVKKVGSKNMARWVVGKTKVFIKNGEDQEVLEQILSSKRLNSVLLIQNWIRSVLNRKTFFYLFRTNDCHDNLKIQRILIDFYRIFLIIKLFCMRGPELQVDPKRL